MKKYLVLVPYNLDINNLIKSDLEKFSKVNNNTVRSIVGTIVKKTAYFSEFGKKSKGISKLIFVPLSSVKLKKTYQEGYKLAMDLLYKRVLFKLPYSEQESYRFSLNDLYVNKMLRVECLDYTSLKDKNIVNRLFKDVKGVDSRIKSRFGYLIKFFCSKRLKIDVQSAREFIEEEYSQHKVFSKYIIDLQKVLDVHNGNYRFSNNQLTDGRFHNNLIQLKKGLRKFVSYDGEKLMEIDISNSAPFLLASLLSNTIKFNISESISDILNSYLYKFLENAVSLDIKETQEFLNCCSSGKIYELFVEDYIKDNRVRVLEYFKIENIDDFDLESRSDELRKLIKKDFLAMLFSKNSQYKTMQNIFSKRFPSIHNLLLNRKKWGSKKLSHLLFQIESYVMLELIAKEFNRQNRGRVPIFTLHDCLFTTESNAEKLRLFVEERFSELFECVPILKTKEW